jgi:hypothetical protein
MGGGGQQNNYVYRKGLGALTKKNPAPRLQFLLFWPQDGKQFPETQILLSLGCVGQ